MKIQVSLTVRGLNKMTKKERQKIARYVRARANWIEKHGDLAASRYTARLYN